jgi:hypothetical protein
MRSWLFLGIFGKPHYFLTGNEMDLFLGKENQGK